MRVPLYAEFALPIIAILAVMVRVRQSGKHGEISPDTFRYKALKNNTKVPSKLEV